MSSSNENFAASGRRDLRATASAARALSSATAPPPSPMASSRRWSTAGRPRSAPGRRSRSQRRDLAAEQPDVRGRVPRDTAAGCDRRASRRAPQTAARSAPRLDDRAARGAGHHAGARARARRRRHQPVLAVDPTSVEVAAGTRTAPVARAPGDVAVLIFTSGTAGDAKAAELTHRAIAWNARALADGSRDELRRRSTGGGAALARARDERRDEREPPQRRRDRADGAFRRRGGASPHHADGDHRRHRRAADVRSRCCGKRERRAPRPGCASGWRAAPPWRSELSRDVDRDLWMRAAATVTA